MVPWVVGHHAPIIRNTLLMHLDDPTTKLSSAWIVSGKDKANENITISCNNATKSAQNRYWYKFKIWCLSICKWWNWSWEGSPESTATPCGPYIRNVGTPKGWLCQKAQNKLCWKVWRMLPLKIALSTRPLPIAYLLMWDYIVAVFTSLRGHHSVTVVNHRSHNLKQQARGKVCYNPQKMF